MKEAFTKHLERGICGGFWGLSVENMEDEMIVQITLGFDGREEKEYSMTETDGLKMDHALGIEYVLVGIHCRRPTPIVQPVPPVELNPPSTRLAPVDPQQQNTMGTSSRTTLNDDFGFSSEDEDEVDPINSSVKLTPPSRLAPVDPQQLNTMGTSSRTISNDDFGFSSEDEDGISPIDPSKINRPDHFVDFGHTIWREPVLGSPYNNRPLGLIFCKENQDEVKKLIETYIDPQIQDLRNEPTMVLYKQNGSMVKMFCDVQEKPLLKNISNQYNVNVFRLIML